MNRVNFFHVLWVSILLSVVVSCKRGESEETVKILFLGNSITHHAPKPEIGWYGDWGMAASSADKDYVHQLIDKLQETYSQTKIEYREQNIARWERDFSTSMVEFTNIYDYEPDILIVRLGENLSVEYAQDNDYYIAISNLIHFFRSSSTAVIITSNFWPSDYKDNIQKQVAIDNEYYYVDLSELSLDASNQAIGEYAHNGVAAHPSDKGMFNISNLIYQCINSNSIFEKI